MNESRRWIAVCLFNKTSLTNHLRIGIGDDQSDEEVCYFTAGGLQACNALLLITSLSVRMMPPV